MAAGLMLTPASTVVILGFGARGAAFAALLAPRGCALRAWDPQLAATDGAALRACIEAAGVDAVADLSAALRGARLVLLDTVSMTPSLAAQLQPGQQLLDLGSAPAADIDTVLAALGLPPGAASWQTLRAAAESPVANSTPTIASLPPVRRGELP
jgi:UDP-N-acetylmuramoylalanine-D-glutamate ligase